MTGGRVTRSGSQLLWNGHSYRFVGINIWRAAVSASNPNNVPINTGYAVNDGTTLADSLASINTPSRNCNVFRFWAFQQFALASHGNTTPATAYNWSAIDKVLAVADAANMKVIPCLADEWNFEGQPEKISNFYTAGDPTMGYDTVVLPYEAYTYRQWVHDFVTRYQNDDRILALEVMNEPGMSDNPANANTLANNWLTDISGIIKGIDPGMLVSTGTAGGGFGFQDSNWLTQLQMSTMDLGSYHDYTGITNLGATQGGTNGLNGRSTQAQTAGKPMYVGEAGLHLSESTGAASTTLNATASSGATSMTVTSISGFASGQNVQIDDGGQVEVVTLSAAPSGNTLTFIGTPLKFTHNSGAAAITVSSVYPINGNRSTRASYMRNKIDYAFNTYPNVVGWMPWHWDSRNYSDDYNYSINDPCLAVLGAYLNG